MQTKLAILALLCFAETCFGAAGTYIGNLPRTNSVQGTNLLIVDIGGLGTNSTHAISVSNLLSVVAPALTNVTYVNPGDDISNLLANARSGQKFMFASLTNNVRGRVPLIANDLAFVDLKLTNVSNVILEGSGSTVFQITNMDGMAFGIQNCTNILFRNITWRGLRTNATTYQAAGITIHGMVQGWGTNDNITFENCRWESNNQFGINFSAEGAGYESKTFGLKTLNCTWFRCGHTNWTGAAQNPDGGAGVGHPEWLMDHCLVEECGRGVEMYVNAGVIDHNFICRDTVFRNNWANGIKFDNGVSYSVRALIDGCHFTSANAARKPDAHIILQDIKSATVSNCTWTNTANGDYCINANANTHGTSGDVNILNNFFGHVSHAVALKYQIGGRISGNYFEWITNATIQLAADGVTVDNNTFVNCGVAGGLGSQVVFCWIDAGTNCVIRNNRFIRKSGGAPDQFIYMDSNQRGYTIADNVYEDVPGGVTVLNDTGVGTRYFVPDRRLTNVHSGVFTNLNALGTVSNLASVVVPAGALTNALQYIHAEWEGQFANALENTNQLQIVYGSETIVDTGLLPASNSTFSVWTKIYWTTTGQRAVGEVRWGPGGGVSFPFTNATLTLAQTNTINTTLALRAGARRLGALTNNTFAARVVGGHP